MGDALLKAEASQAADSVQTLLARWRGVPGTYRPFPPARDRAAWGRLGPEAARLVAIGEAALDTPWPDLPGALFAEFCETGDRIGFETPYFTRRRKLNALALAEAVEGQGRFLPEIEAGIALICAEAGWQLPAHNSNERGGEIFPQPDPARPVVDLFAAETAAQLATLSHLFVGELAPETRTRVAWEVAARVLRPYLGGRFWWMGLDGGRMNNWTVWCTQNVLVAAFLTDCDEAAQKAVLKQSAFSLDAFLAEYGEDGACPEGVYYYRHAALCLFGALRIFNVVTGGALSAVYASEKLRNIAEFIAFAHIGGDAYANFGDAAAVMAPCSAREFLAGRDVGSPALCSFAAGHFGSAFEATDDINLHDRLVCLFAERDIRTDAPAPQPLEGFKPSIGMFMARGATFTVAAKAGHNGDDHNHNDVGSVIVYKHGQPVLIDVGVGTYTRQTFSARRYEIWTMQSSFHNLPEFGGVTQAAGQGFGATGTEAWFGAEAARFETDIAGAYPPEAGIRSYRRVVTLDRAGGVTIEDNCAADRPAILNLMVCERPEITDGTVWLGGLAILTVEGAGRIEAEEIGIDDPRLRVSWPERVYRLRLPFAAPVMRIGLR